MERPFASPPDERLLRSGGPGRQFGPDAPRRNRKQLSRSPKAEHGRGKPIRERRGGQFFGTVDDEPYDETLPGEHGARQLSDPESGE
jgi:hypothetical protein